VIIWAYSLPEKERQPINAQTVKYCQKNFFKAGILSVTLLYSDYFAILFL